MASKCWVSWGLEVGLEVGGGCDDKEGEGERRAETFSIRRPVSWSVGMPSASWLASL